MRQIKAGSADVSVYITIVNSSDGTPETGVVAATAGLALEYVRNQATATSITESDLAATNSAHSDGGIKHLGYGIYRLDLPDAAVAAGVDTVEIIGTVTGMIVLRETLQLVGYDPRTELTTTVLAFINATISSRSSHSAADVWAAGTRTLSAFDWSIITNRTTTVDLTNTRIKNVIDSLSVSLSAADLAAIIAGVNTEVDTILTAVASSFARANAILRASTLSLVQGDTWAEPLTLTPFAWAAGDELRLTVKDVNTYKQSTSDADSILQWLLTNGASASDGLTYINQVAAGANRTKGSLAVVDATTGVITLNLDEAISLLVPGTYVFDVKVFSSAGVITTIGGGTLVVDSTITFSIT